MKKLFTLLAATFCATAIFAQSDNHGYDHDAMNKLYQTQDFPMVVILMTIINLIEGLTVKFKSRLSVSIVSLTGRSTACVQAG